MGRASRDKGNRTERTIVRIGQDHGFAAERIPLSGAAGGRFVGDISIPILGRDRVWEVKCLADGFKYDYNKLAGHDALVKKADNKEPLITLRLKDYMEMAKKAEHAQTLADHAFALAERARRPFGKR